MNRAAWAIACCALWAAPTWAGTVSFVVNDALLKDEPLGGVTVRVAATEHPNAAALAQGTTDEAGVFRAELAPGTYYVSYSKPGYVRIQRTQTQVSDAATQEIVTSLALSLEAEGLSDGTRRFKIVLNWGSDREAHARDLDSHLFHLESGAHVYFGDKVVSGRPELQLDVDDLDWGGPETITLTDPPPGTYYYWVHDFSGAPAVQASEVVVRVISGDSLQAEYRPQGKVADDLQAWRPFAALHVSEEAITVTDWEPEVLTQTPVTAYQLPPGVEGTQAADDFVPESPVPVGGFCCSCFSLLVCLGAVGLGLRSMLKT